MSHVSTVEGTQSHLQACHNCRRARLKCDRSLPQCLKCIKRGQECLGYDRLLRWEQGVASRGKMAGKTFVDAKKHQSKGEASFTTNGIIPRRTLTDPVFQDIDHASRMYLFYFVHNVCKDLVLYDIPKHNPFRELVPMTHQHPLLLHIIIANSALHLSNASQTPLHSNQWAGLLQNREHRLHPRYTNSSMSESTRPYMDALIAKQRALLLLKFALSNTTSMNLDVTLAVILLFIEFELIDSGKDSWKYHVNGARTIINMLCESESTKQVNMSPLRSFLISNCLIYDILGSTLASSTDNAPASTVAIRGLSLLQDAEGNHCSSFPAVLLQLVQSAVHLCQTDKANPSQQVSAESTEARGFRLLSMAHSFDAWAWATDLQPRSPTIDVTQRAHVASAHRAAVCIYISRVILSVCPTISLPDDPESFVSEVMTHLPLICPSDALFTATAWPAFIAGAETSNIGHQAWIARRFQELWEVEPWGLIRGALWVLENIWADRRHVNSNNKIRAPVDQYGGRNWFKDLRGKGADWLIA